MKNALITKSKGQLRLKVIAHSPKFSYAFFRIRYPKNLSRTETLHTESDAY